MKREGNYTGRINIGKLLGIKGPVGLLVLLGVLVMLPFPGLFKVEAGEIYSYVDSNGVYHFTNVPSDPRFTKVEITQDKAVLRGRGYDRPQGQGMVRRGSLGEDDVLSRIEAFAPVIHRAAATFGLDPGLIKAIIRAESGGDPYAISSKGALGLMQLMPDTARELKVYDPLDPTENIFGGSKYLSWLVDRFGGDIITALAAYNAGPGAISRYGGIPPYPETIHYIKKVLMFWKQTNNDKS